MEGRLQSMVPTSINVQLITSYLPNRTIRTVDSDVMRAKRFSETLLWKKIDLLIPSRDLSADSVTWTYASIVWRIPPEFIERTEKEQQISSKPLF